MHLLAQLTNQAGTHERRIAISGATNFHNLMDKDLRIPTKKRVWIVGCSDIPRECRPWHDLTVQVSEKGVNSLPVVLRTSYGNSAWAARRCRACSCYRDSLSRRIRPARESHRSARSLRRSEQNEGCRLPNCTCRDCGSARNDICVHTVADRGQRRSYASFRRGPFVERRLKTSPS